MLNIPRQRRFQHLSGGTIWWLLELGEEDSFVSSNLREYPFARTHLRRLGLEESV